MRLTQTTSEMVISVCYTIVFSVILCVPHFQKIALTEIISLDIKNTMYCFEFCRIQVNGFISRNVIVFLWIERQLLYCTTNLTSISVELVYYEIIETELAFLRSMYIPKLRIIYNLILSCDIKTWWSYAEVHKFSRANSFI